MELAEVLFRYRSFGIKRRLLIVSVFSVSWVVYLVLDKANQLDEKLVQVIQEKSSGQQNLTKSLKKEKELPTLEKKLYLLVEELEKTKKIIPDHFPIDQILQKTALTAQDVDLKMEEFVPGTPIPSTTEFRYASLPIQVRLIGSYEKIVSFIDKVVHWPVTVHVTNFHLSLVDILVGEPSYLEGKTKNNKNGVTKISATMDVVLYRSLSNVEIVSIQKSEAEKKNIEKKKRTH